MQKTLKLSWRGDNRDFDTVQRDGGFLPRYLMDMHAGGFNGYIACQNKQDRVLGCGCNGFSEADLFRIARQEFLELMKKPGDLQAHVIARFGDGSASGIKYVSTGTVPDEAFDRDHKYSVTAVFYAYTIEQAAARFRTNSRIRGLDKAMKVFIDSMNIGTADLIAMVPPRSPNELTFITPVRARYITEVV